MAAEESTPLDYFIDLPRKLGWKPDTDDASFNAVKGIDPYVLKRQYYPGTGEPIRLFATTSSSSEGRQRFAQARFDQTWGSDPPRRGVLVEVQNENEENGELSGLIFQIRVINKYPPRGRTPEKNTIVTVTFDGNGRFRSALLNSQEVHEDFSYSDDEQYIDDSPIVAAVLKRIKLIDPDRQIIDAKATVHALMTGVSEINEKGESQPVPGDILSLICLKEAPLPEKVALAGGTYVDFFDAGGTAGGDSRKPFN